jgi:hypothetical protein
MSTTLEVIEVVHELVVDGDPNQTTHVVEEVISILEVAEQGPAGQPGAPGSGSDSFEHVQNSPATEWVVNHNLGRRPNATVVNTGGQEIGAEIIHMSVNQLRVYLNVATAGRVLCG